MAELVELLSSPAGQTLLHALVLLLVALAGYFTYLTRAGLQQLESRVAADHDHLAALMADAILLASAAVRPAPEGSSPTGKGGNA